MFFFKAYVRFIIQKLKNKHTFLETEKAKFSRQENSVFSVGILLEENMHNYVKQNITMNFIIKN